MDLDKVKETARLFEEMDGNVSETARRLGVSRSTVRRRLEAPEAIEPEEQLPPTERQRLIDRAGHAEKTARAAVREANAIEDFRVGVLKLAKREVPRPRWFTETSGGLGASETPILLTSDFQWGEKIISEEVGGINEFNADIARVRYRRLIAKATDIAQNHIARPNYPGLIYLRGGDAISGDIHDELRETNDLQSIPATMDLLGEEAEGVAKCADAFGRVHVVSVPGNHGRTTRKPHAKSYVNLNYEVLLSWFLEREFKNDDRVTFEAPMSGDALFKVYDWKFLLTHGDRIGSRGGQGFIGPVATVARGAQKLRMQYATMGHKLDLIMMGHFHTPLWMPGCVVNGCLPGFSEYAFGPLRVTPTPPSQWLFFVHPKYGVTSRWEIFLEDPKMYQQIPLAALAA